MPRLNVEIDDELDHKLDMCLPWGTRSEIVRILLKQFVSYIFQHGHQAVDLIMTDKVSITEEVARRTSCGSKMN